MGIKIRIQAGSLNEVEAAIDFLKIRTSGAVKCGKPRKGTNPRYEGQQVWASYGEIDLIVAPPGKGGVI